jgi:hypothetical protein
MNISVDMIPTWRANRMARLISEAVESASGSPTFAEDYKAWIAAGGLDRYPAPSLDTVDVEEQIA